MSKKRSFSIDWILGSECGRRKDCTVTGQQGGNTQKLEENIQTGRCKFFKRLENKRISSQKFKVDRIMTSFTFEKLEKCVDPEKVLFECINECVEEAITQGRQDNQNPNKIGIHLKSAIIPGGISIPLREINSNTTEAIFNKILDVNSHYDSPNIFGDVFEIYVTTACASAPGKVGKYSKKLVGSGNTIEHVPEKAFVCVNNEDTYCLFYACELSRIYSTGELRKFQFYNRVKSKGKLSSVVQKLMINAGIPLQQSSYDAEEYLPKLQSYYDRLYPSQYKIFVFNRIMGYKPIYKTEAASYSKAITIYHTGTHFRAIRHLSSLFGKPYCITCENTYDKKSRHRLSCMNRCLNCSEMGPAYPCKSDGNFRQTCNNCDKTFVNKICFDRHIKSGFCGLSKKCLKCGIIYSLHDVGNRGHVCEERFCRTCHSYHTKERGCFIRKQNIPKFEPIRYIFFDMECVQEKRVNGKNWHEPNLIVASITCNKCMDTKISTCNVCTSIQTVCFSNVNFTRTRFDNVDICDNPLNKFLEWIVEGTKMCKKKTILYSHYGGRYDMTLLFGELFRNKIITPPKVIRRGCKLYQIKIEKGVCVPADIIFRDSFNFVGMPLSQFVSTFQLNMESKMFFPHFYNKRENYNTILPHLPSKDDYNYNGMKPKQRKELIKWWKTNYNTSFNLNETLAEYCLSDVEILAAGMTKFRKMMFQVTNIDLLQTSMTMASACLRHWRTNHINDQHIAIISELGHDLKHNQSELALKYLKWLGKTEGLNIHTYDDYGGEHKVCVEKHTYLLDGYVKGGGSNGRDLAIEVNGCAWHGHTCFGDDSFPCPNGNTVEQNRKRTMDREDAIKTIMDVRVIYECEINDQLRKNKEMKDFFKNCKIGGPISPRDAFHGGRTGPTKLYARYKSGYKITYRDFVSLYPATIMNGTFPVKHPKLLIINEEVHWVKKEDNPYIGLLKVLILPPKDIKQPAVPLKVDERLLFPICRKCSLKYKEGGHTVTGKRLCHCSENERSFVATFTHNELNLALENGYIVKKLFRVNTFDESDFDGKLFKSYVREFMKIKIESSGWPSDKKTMEEREAWLKENENIYGINIDAANMIRNEGLRWIAKTCLNSLWGRLSLRNDLSMTKIIYDPEELNQLHCDSRVEINAIDFLDEEMEYIMVTYSPKEGYVEENPASNILISLWTTSLARIKLYEQIKKVSNAEKCSLLYMDTDSLIYMHPIGADPLEDAAGDHLGQLKDELPDREIVEYVSSRCKAYGMKTVNKADMTKWIDQNKEKAKSLIKKNFEKSKSSAKNEKLHIYKSLKRPRNNQIKEDVALKIRSISFDYRTAKCLPYKTFRKKVFTFAKKGSAKGIKVTYPHSLKPDKFGNVWTVAMSKTFNPKCPKGIVSSDFFVYPLGY